MNNVCAFHGKVDSNGKQQAMLAAIRGSPHLQVRYYLGNASGQSLPFTLATSPACAPVHTLVEAGKVAGPFAFGGTPVLTCMGTRLYVGGTTVIPRWGHVSATEGPGTVVLNAYPDVPTATAGAAVMGAACPPGEAWCAQCKVCMKKLPPGQTGPCCNLSGFPQACGVFGTQVPGTINCE